MDFDLDTESERNMNKVFQALATNIIPHEEYSKDRKNVAHQILEHLKRNSRFDIGRDSIAGSSGKKTTIIDSDFDFIAFINHEEPIFEEVLDDFEDCLTMASGYNIQDIRKRKYSVQFQSGGFEFDLLPAPNFVVSTQSLSGDDLIDLQQRKTLDKIKQNPGKYRYAYSSGISEAVVRFIRKQDGFVNEMIRICKFWYKSVSIKSAPSGAKALFEFVAVHAANKEESFEKKSYLRCFARFLSFIRNFENLNIVFEEECKKFPEHQVPHDIRSQRPLVLEPANPYNNLARKWKKDSIDLLKGYATETTRRLQRMHMLTNANRGVVYIPMEELFEPQPKAAQFFSPAFKNPTWLVSTKSEVIIYPDMKVRNENVMKMEVARDLKVFQTYLSILLHGYTANPRADISTLLSDLQNQTKTFIDKISGIPPRTWSSSTNRHEDYDVTFTIPLDKCCVLVSWKQTEV